MRSFFYYLIQNILNFIFSRQVELSDTLEEHDVATTATLTNYWKDIARQKNHWPETTIKMGTRAKDLYKDPYLSFFYNQATMNEAKSRLDIRMWLPLATRSKFFRQTLSFMVKNHGVKQVVILGSGFDTLAVRKRKYTEQYGIQFYEIDFQKILNCKAAIYQTHQLEKNAEYIGMDYTQENFIEALMQRNINLDLATFVLWEGNTFYLDKAKVLSILANLQQSFRTLMISFDFMHPKIAEEEKTIDAFAKRQSPFKTFFHPEEIIEECQKVGLQCFTHYTTDKLAEIYEIDEAPYHTAKPYSVISMQSNFFKDQAHPTTPLLVKQVRDYVN